MDVIRFSKILKDTAFPDYKKLQHKYPTDFADFLDAYRQMVLCTLTLSDFNGKPAVYAKDCAPIDKKAVKLLLRPQDRAFGVNAAEEEIASTAAIESIDFNRDSIRSIVKGMVPKDEAETRILGLKNGLDFIANRSNQISEENLFVLYRQTVGDFLPKEESLKSGCLYRHDSVYVVSDKPEHAGIDYRKLPDAMRALIDFANADDDIDELHKAAILHFYLAYLHPYFDGNGRIARMLHLWFLLQNGYETALFVPFSSLIARSRKKYYGAFTLAEENYKLTGLLDVTPFLMYCSDCIYNVIAKAKPEEQTLMQYSSVLAAGDVTEKEAALWKFVLSQYGGEGFSTKQLEKDFGNAAYATIRSFVLHFTSLGLLTASHMKNRVKYKIR